MSDAATETWSRVPKRSSNQKAFAHPYEAIAGQTNAEKFKSYPKYANAQNLYQACNMYAHSYAMTMVTRVM